MAVNVGELVINWKPLHDALVSATSFTAEQMDKIKG